MKMSNRKFKDIDEYINTFPPDVQKILEQLRTIIKAAAPNAVETIRYGMPTFRLGENLVHFAAFEHHIGFYPTPSGVAAFEQDLSHYKHGKGSIQFPIDGPIPFGLVKKIVTFRIEEINAKRKPKK